MLVAEVTLMRTTVLAFLLSLAAAAQAATYHAGTPNNQLISVGTKFDCATTLYDPDVYQLSDGRLLLWGQGGSGASCSKGIDSLYTARYTPAVNNWRVPLATDCASITGPVVCDQYVPNVPDPTGPVASPAAVKIGSKVFMAYVGGNADLERGRVNWAVGPDSALTLSVYPSAASPISLITPTPTSKTFCQHHGVGQVQLAYENGFFYFFVFYFHFTDGGDGPYSTIAYRINYDSTNAWGLGTIRQIYNGATNSWVAHNGNIIFDYDQAGGLPIYGNYDLRNLQFAGEGDIKWDPARQRWIHIWGGTDNNLYWQETTVLDTGSWSAPVAMDIAALRAKYPTSPILGPSFWYGDITADNVANPRWYLFAPVHGGAVCPGGIFAGNSVAMMTLDFY